MAQDATEQSTEPNDNPQTPPEPATPPQAPARDTATAGTDTPPWERDGEEFDPAKAWSLIRHLREDNTKLRESNESNAARLREIEDAKLSERERLERDLKEAREQLASVNNARAWAEARARYPQLSEDDLELIGGASARVPLSIEHTHALTASERALYDKVNTAYARFRKRGIA